MKADVMKDYDKEKIPNNHNKINGIKKIKFKTKNKFPVIQRSDIMSLILSNTTSNEDRLRFSRLYDEILQLETIDYKYITHITVSSKDDAEIYELILNYKEKL